MIWNLEEFFKDKNDYLDNLSKLSKICQNALEYEKYNFETKEEIIKFLNFYKTYSEIECEFITYIELLKTENYKNNNVKEYENKLNKLTTKMDNLFEKIFKKIKQTNNLEKYNLTDEYKGLFETFKNEKETETTRNIKLFYSLYNDMLELNIEPTKFKNTFLEIINNYFKSFINKEESYEEIIFKKHPEINKKELKKLFNIIGESSNLNLCFIYMLVDLNENIIPKINYETAKEKTLKSYNILGKEYINTVKLAFQNNRIDHQIRKDKPDVNITYTIKNHNAFVSINYDEDIESVLTLSHELGHLVEHDLKMKNNKEIYVTPASELYSLTNELITGNYLLKHANTLEEKTIISLNLIKIYITNIYQTLAFSDLSLRINKKILKDGNIDLKSINGISNNVIKKFNILEDRYCWINEDIFETLNQIVYAYGMIGASNICSNIESKSLNIKDYIYTLKEDKYKNFELYDKLDSNPIKEENIKKALKNYKNLMTNTEDLVYELKKRR